MCYLTDLSSPGGNVGKDSAKIRQRRPTIAVQPAHLYGMLEAVTAALTTSESQHQLAKTKRGSAHLETAAVREPRSRLPGARVAVPRPGSAEEGVTKPLHWPSWRSHRAYVVARGDAAGCGAPHVGPGPVATR